MPIFQKVKHYFSRQLVPAKNESPQTAYNVWAKNYDSQPDNLMLSLDEEIFSALLNEVDMSNAIIADIGCGTGRHWEKIFEKKPGKLVGFDVSEEMLKMLKQKFPAAETYLLINNELRQLQNESCDIVISTLTIAHIKNADVAIAEWNRVLKPGGHIIITDYHPSALQNGAKRTFKHNNKTIAVKNYVHTLNNLKEIARQLHLQECRLLERKIDESAKPFYEKQNAIDVYEKWKGIPIIYGMCLKNKMLLCNLHIIGKKDLQNIRITNDKITAVTEAEEYSTDSKENESKITFSDALAFPGLINSHDHLDFNLFPQTGNRIYNNYTEWGKDIHDKNRQTIDAVLKIPEHLRTQWGLYKNLLSGVTTVVNHGKKLTIKTNLINVIQSAWCLHSIQFEKNWKWKLNRIFAKNQPFVIHIGEGTDKASREEIDELIKWNLFKKKLIGVHGVAMDDKQAANFKALIWCPASNYFLLNGSAMIDELKAKTFILFGTDSTLTASWNLWEHLRLARDTLLLTDAELFDSLTQTAATIWKQNSTASIAINKHADIIVANANNKTGFDAFYSINPEDIQLILYKGKIRLFDDEIKNQLAIVDFSFTGFSKIVINKKIKYVEGDVTGLVNEILSYYPDASLPINIL